METTIKSRAFIAVYKENCFEIVLTNHPNVLVATVFADGKAGINYDNVFKISINGLADLHTICLQASERLAYYAELERIKSLNLQRELRIHKDGFIASMAFNIPPRETRFANILRTVLINSKTVSNG